MNTTRPPRWRKKPVEIEAIQWTGSNEDVLRHFTARSNGDITTWGVLFDGDGDGQVYDKLHSCWVPFKLNDWIIRGIQDEFYPCKPDIFAATYQPVSETEVPA